MSAVDPLITRLRAIRDELDALHKTQTGSEKVLVRSHLESALSFAECAAQELEAADEVWPKEPETPKREPVVTVKHVPMYCWDYAATGRTQHVFKSTGDVRNDRETLCGKTIQRGSGRRVMRGVVCKVCQRAANIIEHGNG